MQSTIRTFCPIWSNTKWKSLVRNVAPEEPMVTASVVDPSVREEQEVDLLTVLDVKAARTFGNWVSGLSDFERREERERERLSRQRSGKDTSAGVNSMEEASTAFEAVPEAANVETRRSSAREGGVRGEPTELMSEQTDTLGLTKGSPLAMDVDEDDIAEPELRPESHPVSPRMDASLEDDDRILESMTTESTVLIKLRRPHNIWLELMKTPLAQQPKSTTTSLLIIQAIPRSAREVEMLGRAGNKSAFTNGESFLPDGVGHLLSPSIDMDRVSISRSTDQTRGADTTPGPHAAWPFLTHSKDASGDTMGAETPTADRDDPMLIAGTVKAETEDELARRRALVSRYYPDEEPVLVGDFDLGQLTSFPRKSVEDPLSTEYLLLNTDWSKTPLGPLEAWPSSLKTSISIVMAMPNQAMLWWNGGNGNKDDLTLVYNDHYAAMLQSKHPWLFGKTSAEGWAEVRPGCIRGAFAKVDPSPIDLVRFGAISGEGHVRDVDLKRGRRVFA
jgi:hypothetical protein